MPTAQVAEKYIPKPPRIVLAHFPLVMSGRLEALVSLAMSCLGKHLKLEVHTSHAVFNYSKHG